MPEFRCKKNNMNHLNVAVIIENKADGLKQLREWEALLANNIRDPVYYSCLKDCQEIAWRICEVLGALVRMETTKEQPTRKV